MSPQRLLERLRHDGPVKLARTAAYRLMRSGTGLHVVHIFELHGGPKAPGSEPDERLDGLEVRFLTAPEVAALAVDSAHELAPFLAGRIEAGVARCLAAFDGEDLAAFVWLGGSDFPAEWVYGPPLAVPPGTLYLHNAVTLLPWRGRGVYPALANVAAATAGRLLFTVEAGNHPSLKAALRMGATNLGLGVTWGMPGRRVLRSPAGLRLRPLAGRLLREDQRPDP